MLRRALVTLGLLLAASPAWAAATLFPTILVDSASGSDSVASGAGPGTAITGVACVSAADGLSVIIDGSPDLTGVAVDGSAALYFADATAGQRNFARITATSGSGGPTATVTISEAVQAVQTKACAVGGKRAAVWSTTSSKLFSNNSGNGDAMPGWIVEMQSGHSEAITAAQAMRRAGDQTGGPITLRGASGAATMPIISSNQNGIAINQIGAWLVCQDFELKNTNGTKTASEGIRMGGTYGIATGMRIKDASNFWKALLVNSGGALIYGNDLRATASHAIDVSQTSPVIVYIFNNYIRGAGGSGIAITQSVRGYVIQDNVIYLSTADGINVAAVANAQGGLISGNTLDSNVDGIDIAADLENKEALVVKNNIFSNNSGYGLKWNGATNAAIIGAGTVVLGNAYFNNTSGDSDGYLGTAATQAVNPSYTNAGSDDFSIGSGLASKGYPVGGTTFIGGTSATYSYVDPGAAQRVPSAGGTPASFYIGQ